MPPRPASPLPVALAAVAPDADAPQIVEAGGDERLGALRQNPTTQRLVEAMYPGGEAAQAAALAKLEPNGRQPDAGRLNTA
ncbi:hypothetical protein ACIBAG_11990 [Streptomyces sp. NPDC051243]|uniref:hypothetical protein n=1 Tax=Streptomyces sp. NPDC051243 TaxID=3365646 RepID=UPI0037A5E551